MTPTRFTSDEAHRAGDAWGSNCGPGALAAIMGMTLDEVRPHIPSFDVKRYTDPAMMNAALRSLGAGWQKIGRAWPGYGLVRVQWHGPWMAAGVPHRERYPQSHWIGVDLDDWRVFDGRVSSAVFDINCMADDGGWVSFFEWDTLVVPWLLEGSPATGEWSIMCAIEVDPPTSRVPGNSQTVMESFLRTAAPRLTRLLRPALGLASPKSRVARH